MTDLPEFDDRHEKIAARIESFLREGDRFVVEMFDGEVRIEEAAVSSLERRSPRLYGRLLSLNEQLESGCGLIAAPLVFSGVLSFALHARFVEPWVGIDLNDKLASWWFYLLLLLVLGGFGFWMQEAIEKGRYRRARSRLARTIEEEEADWDTLIAELHRVPELANVYRRMKLDGQPHEGESR
ncbi:MAG: hypothetical protein K2X38_13475 [Gemmataceae bacterium]|nr:hypothetical protein [Gemmataceae bacterium]